MGKQFHPVTPELIKHLQQIVGDANVSTTDADIETHSHDWSKHTPRRSEVIVWVNTPQQVADVLRLANENRVAVTAWGAGTSLEGNCIPMYGGVLLSVTRMNRVLSLHADDFQVTVEPGISHNALNNYLKPHGLFYAPDPGADSSIGGMLANNASGTRTVRYGASKDNVLRMQVALADGRLIEVGSRSVKQASGYNLLQTFVGSEGTLGVITEATLRLFPLPRCASAAVAAFDTVEDAVRAVVDIRSSGLDPAALEFVDADHMRLLIEAEGLDMLPLPTVFMEFHAAHEAALIAGMDTVRVLCAHRNGKTFNATSDPDEREKLWYARHRSYNVLSATHPHDGLFIMDVAVPISAYPEIVTFMEQITRETKTVGYMIGHAGDGNIHMVMPFNDDESYQRTRHINEQVVLKALALGGTATGEHGVGIGKARFMPHEHGAALDVMRDVKAMFDPNNILNPGKIFP